MLAELTPPLPNPASADQTLQPSALFCTGDTRVTRRIIIVRNMPRCKRRKCTNE